MRFQLTASASEVLRVIPEIPSFELGLVEGRNGVGKSLAVRLLQLATGDQPFDSLPAAWRSLRAELDFVDITVSELRGAEEIKCRLATADWPESPAQPEDWIGEFWIDGTRATLADVRVLLRVLRVAGDETLADTIALRIRADRGLLNRWTGPISQVTEKLDSNLAAVSARLLAADPAGLLVALDALPIAEAHLARLRDETSQVAHRLEDIEEASALARRAQGLELEAPELRRRIEALQNDIKARDEAISRLELERSELQTQAAREDEVRRKLSDLDKQMTREARAVADTQRRMEDLASELGVAPVDDAVVDALAVSRTAISELLKARTSMDATPRLKSLGTSIGSHLDRAEADGLGGLALARLANGQALSIAELRAAVRAYRAELDNQPPVGGVARINRQLVMLRNREEQLVLLQRRMVRYRNAVARLSARQEEMSAIATALDPSTTARFNEITDELRPLAAEQIQAHVDRARLISQLNQLSGGASIEEVKGRYQAALERAALGEGELAEALETARGDLRALEHELAEVEQQVGATQASIESGRVEVAGAVRQLVRTRDFDWLVKSPSFGPLPSERSTERTQANRLINLLSQIDLARDRLQLARNSVLSLLEPLDELAASVERGRLVAATQASEFRRRFERLSELYSHDLGQLLNQPAIAEALFQDGIFSSLDLVGQTVSWRTINGDIRSRPLEAFSSGERAFAYTLARLESLRGVQAANRVVALDEFGAFIASDRLQRLVSFIEAKVLNDIADQVLIILPLRQDYEASVAGATGPLRRDLEARAEAISARGYLVESLAGTIG